MTGLIGAAVVALFFLGVDLIRKHQGNAQAILTHCNTGSLATGGIGSALGVIKTAHRQGKRVRVVVDETVVRANIERMAAAAQ